jgi:MFS family permease
MEAGAQTATIETRIPARLDRLPWGRFHWLVVIGLGTVWILDGLEVTIVGSIAARLAEKGSGIELGAGQIGTAAAFYVAGACTGALFFGQLTDRFGRKRLFLITLGLYIAATVATAFAFAPWYFFAARFLTGAGIGGEYAAINSAIDELIPARVRGRVDLIINGSYWVGAAVGAIAAIFFLDTSIFASDLGWRLAFGMGAVLGLTILLIRRNVPESPRWLFIHGREEEAEAIVDSIESGLQGETGRELPEPKRSVTVRQRKSIHFGEIARTAFKSYPKRTTLGFSLFVGQAFLYNAITFDLGTILATYFGIASGSVPFYIGLFAIANFLGPLTLGRLFDTVGRKPMVSGTYLASAVVAVALGTLLASGGGKDGELSTWAFMGLVMGTFFLASAGASSAYLTVSEIFPMETRALAIAFFYAIGTAVGGITGPLLFGHLIASGDPAQLAFGFYIGAAMMAVGGIAEVLFGVRAEQESLEDVATPLSATENGGPEGRAAPGPDLRPQIQEARRHREEAAHERARAAEHRALAHEHRGTAIEHGNEDSTDGEVEEALARIADLHAEAQEELAGACEEAAEASDRAEGAARLAGEERAGAARERARMRVAQAEAIASERGRDAQAHDAFARASAERALAAEQRALAAERAGQADELEAEAQGAERAAREEREAERRDRRLRERDERIRSRLERRGRDRRGLRRFRPGPGPFYSPLPTLALGIDDPDELDHEVDAISRALEERGEMSREELARALGARFWGPGRFRAALRQAVLEGAARRSSRDRFAPGDDGAPEQAPQPVHADSAR